MKSYRLITILFLILISTAISVNAVLTDNLVSYWNATTFNDSLSKNNITNSNTAIASYGLIGSAFNTTASSSRQAYLADSASISNALSTGFTINTWLKLTSQSDGQLFNKWYDGSVRAFNYDITSTGLNILIANSAGSAAQITYAPNLALPTNGSWTMLTITWSPAQNKVILYKDGVNVGNSTTGAGTISKVNTANVNLFSDAGGTTKIYGLVDEMGLWNTTLTASDVVSLYNNGTGFTYPFNTTSTPSTPTIEPIVFISQNPSDITSTSIFSGNVNITYNFTTTNLTLPRLNYTVYGGLSCVEMENGTCLFINNTYETISNTSTIVENASKSRYSFSLTENDFYPHNENLPPSSFLTPKTTSTLTTNNDLIGQTFINLTTTGTLYNVLEVMSNTTGTSKVYACNSSYQTGKLDINTNCQEIGNINNQGFNHTHDTYSAHNLIPFTIINGKIGGIGITATTNMTFFIRGQNGITTHAYYITTPTRTNSLMTSNNLGVGYTYPTGTLDAHIHQYIGNEYLKYTAIGLYNGTTILNSSYQTDLINVTSLFPSSPIITNPFDSNLYNRYLNIAWLNSTPNGIGVTITKYNITLLNSDLTFNKTITTNAGINNTFQYDLYGNNVSIGTYYVRVYAYDSNGLSSYDEEQFTINTNAIMTFTVKRYDGGNIITNYSIIFSNGTTTYNQTFNNYFYEGTTSSSSYSPVWSDTDKAFDYNLTTSAIGEYYQSSPANTIITKTFTNNQTNTIPKNIRYTVSSTGNAIHNGFYITLQSLEGGVWVNRSATNSLTQASGTQTFYGNVSATTQGIRLLTYPIWDASANPTWYINLYEFEMDNDFDVIKNSDMNLTISSFGYADESESFTTNNTVFNQFKTMLLYITNSLTINILDADTSLPILQTIDVDLFGNLTTYTGLSTSTGYLLLNNLTADIYTVQISDPSLNYSSNNYVVTILNNSHQTLNARLTPAPSTIQMYIKSVTNLPIENALITIQQPINSTYITIAQEYTDINGYARFSLSEGDPYRVIIDADEYVLKTFTIKFYTSNSPYTFILTSNVGYIFSNSLNNVSFSYSPTNLTLVNGTIVFSFNTYSANGTILWTSLTTQNGTINVSGSPSGSTINKIENLNAWVNRKYQVRYCFLVDGNTQSYCQIVDYVILGTQANNYNLQRAAESIKNDWDSSTDGRFVYTLIGMMVILAIVITIYQLTGNPNISTILATAGIILFTAIGWFDGLTTTALVIIIVIMFFMNRNGGGY